MSESALGTVEGMSRERGDQPTRRTVAELLEQHGAKPANSPRRHRRRAAQDDGEDELTTTAPQAIIDRINSEQPDADSAPTRRNGSPHSHASPDEPPAPPHAAQPQAPQPPPPVRPAPQPPQQPPQPPASGYHRTVPPPSSPSWPATAPPKQEQPQEPPQPPQQQPPQQQQQSLGARLGGFAAARQRPPVEDSTEQMPVVDAPVEDAYGYAEDYEDFQDGYQHGYPGYQDFQDDYEYDEDYQGYPTGYPGAAEHGDPYGFVEDYEDDYPADYPPGYEGNVGGQPVLGDPDGRAPTGVFAPVGPPDEEADVERFDAEDEPETHRKEWLAVAAQLTLGVVGGAGVWLLFNWLWMQLPAAALVAALVVVVGLVWIVRKIRKAEDMQTTVLAVLVGVVVTVSPAALLLLDR